jgi:HD-like signal output (HDOD) protein
MKLIKIFLQIEKSIIAGDFTLPALPAIALKVRKAVQEPLTDLTKLASVVKLDSSFTAYLINLANSPIYRGIASIDSVQMALGRMGMESTRNTAMIFAVRSLFTTNNKTCKKLLNLVWKQSCRVSALSFVMAKNLKTVNPEKASIAGLLHNIGMIPVLMRLVEQGESEETIIESWEEIIHFSRKISARVLSHWGLDDDLKAVVKNIEEWGSAHDEPLVNLINLALWHNYLGTAKFKTLPHLDLLGYFQVNPMLELDASESLLFIKESNDEIKQMMQALNG